MSDTDDLVEYLDLEPMYSCIVDGYEIVEFWCEVDVVWAGALVCVVDGHC